VAAYGDTNDHKYQILSDDEMVRSLFKEDDDTRKERKIKQMI
jgi:hypothetical protein